MSYISPQGEQSSEDEIDVLTGLSNLSTSGEGQYIQKTGSFTFKNTTETDPIWTADKPNYALSTAVAATYLSKVDASNTYLSQASASTTYVPYTGANADVDLGEYSITASHFVSTSDYIKLYNQTGVEFYSDEGETFFGSINLSEPGIYNFSNDIGGLVNLDFSGLTDTRVFTFPAQTGTIALTSDIPDISGYVPFTGTDDEVLTVPNYKSITLYAGPGDGDADCGNIILSTEAFMHQTNGYVGLQSRTSNAIAKLNPHSITEDRTFTFPDHTGNILVDGADVDLGAFGLTTNDITISSLTNTYIPYASTAGLLSNSGLYWDNTNTRLGIGTTTPSYPLHVHSTSVVPAAFSCNNSSYGNSVLQLINYKGSTTDAGGVAFNLISGDFFAQFEAFHKAGGAGQGVAQFGTYDVNSSTCVYAGANAFYVNGTGTSSLYYTPTTTNTSIPMLQLIRQTTTTGAAGIGCSLEFYNNSDFASGWYVVSGRIESVLSDAAKSTYDSYMAFWTGNNGSFTEKVRIDNVGNVGIGTTAPDKQLEINSATGDCLRLTYNDANGSATAYVDLLTTSGGDLTITPSGGDISIGTANLGTTGALKGVHKAADGTGAVADGTYTVGIGGTTNGTITIKDGIITAIQQAVA